MSIDSESYYKRLKCISDEINHHLIVLNQIGTLEEPQFNHLCEDAVKTAKELSGELTEKLDIEIEKSKEVNTWETESTMYLFGWQNPKKTIFKAQYAVPSARENGFVLAYKRYDC